MPSSPNAWLNRFQSRSGAPPGDGTVTRWIRSGGRSAPQRSRMSGISWTLQNQDAIRLLRAGSVIRDRNRA